MALHDFRCTRCHAIVRDVNVPITIGARAAHVPCPRCKARMENIPAVARMDAANGPGFTAFDTFNGRNEKVHVSSLKQLREIERQSEIDHRNGEGQPLVFRAFSNEPSKMDASALHKSWEGGEQPTPEAKHRFGATLQKAAEAPEVGFGPGVSESNASALGMGGGE